MTQEEMVSGARTVAAGLEALRAEHAQLLAGLAANTEHDHEKAALVRKSIDSIELGLGEAQVSETLATFKADHAFYLLTRGNYRAVLSLIFM